MRSVLCASLMLVLIPNGSAVALPGDSAEGKRLYDANCTGCHDTGVYTRKDRAVHSLDELKKRLSDCGHAANKQFSAAESQDIVKYLNDTFYRFD